MGTRGLVIVEDNGAKGKGVEIAVLYRQFDCYPSGLGEELAKFLKPMTVINGFNNTHKAGTHANGMSCLFAQLIAHLKDGLGSVYLYPAGTRGAGEEYIYTIYLDDTLKMRVLDVYENNVIFDGTPEEFLTEDWNY